MNITVVVTNYNKSPKLLARCISSIESFGLKYVIVDDCSKYTEHLSRYTNVIQLLENIGTYRAFYRGLLSVKTLYTMRVDADDYITGVPDVLDEYDAYVNNIHGKISLTPKDFTKKPYAGLNGIVVKTDILKKVWKKDIRYYGDIIIFNRLIMKYKCVMNSKSLYVYDISNSGITKMKDHVKYLEVSKKIMRSELRGALYE